MEGGDYSVLNIVPLAPVAKAGFSKGGGPENLRIMKTRMKIFQPKTKSFFLPKIRWRPKKQKKKVFTQI